MIPFPTSLKHTSMMRTFLVLSNEKIRSATLQVVLVHVIRKYKLTHVTARFCQKIRQKSDYVTGPMSPLRNDTFPKVGFRPQNKTSTFTTFERALNPRSRLDR